MQRPSYLHLQLYGLQPRTRSLLLADRADPRRGKGVSRWRALAREQFLAQIEFVIHSGTTRRRIETMLKGTSRMNIRPLHDRIIVHRLEESEQRVGGIIIPDTAKEKPQQGTVIARWQRQSERRR